LLKDLFNQVEGSLDTPWKVINKLFVDGGESVVKLTTGQ